MVTNTLALEQQERSKIWSSQFSFEAWSLRFTMKFLILVTLAIFAYLSVISGYKVQKSLLAEETTGTIPVQEGNEDREKMENVDTATEGK